MVIFKAKREEIKRSNRIIRVVAKITILEWKKITTDESSGAVRRTYAISRRQKDEL